MRRNGYQNGLCFSCEEPLAAELVHVDYVIPRAFLNHDESWNLVLTPSRCYLEKSARLPSRPPFSKPAAVDGLALDVSVVPPACNAGAGSAFVEHIQSKGRFPVYIEVQGDPGALGLQRRPKGVTGAPSCPRRRAWDRLSSYLLQRLEGARTKPEQGRVRAMIRLARLDEKRSQQRNRSSGPIQPRELTYHY